MFEIKYYKIMINLNKYNEYKISKSTCLGL